MGIEFHRFADATGLAQAAASRWLSELARLAAAGRNSISVALSGGRIAGRLFEETARIGRDHAAALSLVRWFWADERCVPPDHSASNYGLADRLLLRPLRVSQERVHRIRGELSPREAATHAATDFDRHVVADSSGHRCLDLVLLGMGEDGHVASLFPENLASDLTRGEAYFDVVASKPPPHRVTLGFRPVWQASKVWVIVAGHGKETALRESVDDGTTPLGHVIRNRTATELFVAEV